MMDLLEIISKGKTEETGLWVDRKLNKNSVLVPLILVQPPVKDSEARPSIDLSEVVRPS